MLLFIFGSSQSYSISNGPFCLTVSSSYPISLCVVIQFFSQQLHFQSLQHTALPIAMVIVTLFKDQVYSLVTLQNKHEMIICFVSPSVSVCWLFKPVKWREIARDSERTREKMSIESSNR